MSSPNPDCAAPPFHQVDPTNATTVASYAACNAEIAGNFGATLKYYGTYYAAADYRAVMNMVGPGKVAIYALNTYLHLDGARVDVAVMDGPVVLHAVTTSQPTGYRRARGEANSKIGVTAMATHKLFLERLFTGPCRRSGGLSSATRRGRAAWRRTCSGTALSSPRRARRGWTGPATPPRS